MFQVPHNQDSSRILWTIIPLVTIGFLTLVGLVIYLLQPKPQINTRPTGILVDGNPDYDWYRNYVELKNPKISMGKNFAGKRMVMFAGRIENNGEKTLDAVEVKLVLFNFDKTVWETTRIPIRPDPGTYTPPIPPFRSRGFTLYLETVSEDWHANHAEMDIRGFRFKD